MTIAAGFVCSDGVLLASDTLFSNTGTGLRYGPKFWPLDFDDVLVVFGGAGSEAGLLRTRDEIHRKLKPGMSRVDVVDKVDSTLLKVAKKLRPDPIFATQALVAIRIKNELILYQNAGEMLYPVVDSCQCVGWGQSLGWYFAKSLFRPGMSMRWARIVAAHLIRNVKAYCETCGGDTHLIEVPFVGAARFTEARSEIEALERYLAPLDEALRIVLPGDDPNASDLTLAHRMEMLREAIEKARTLAVAVGGTILSGATIDQYCARATEAGSTRRTR